MEAVRTDYYANFTMTRGAGLGDKVCVMVSTTPTRVEVCSFDLEDPLPVLLWSDRDNAASLSLPREVEYRRMVAEFAPKAVASSRIAVQELTLMHVLQAMGLPR